MGTNRPCDTLKHTTMQGRPGKSWQRDRRWARAHRLRHSLGILPTRGGIDSYSINHTGRPGEASGSKLDPSPAISLDHVPVWGS